MPDGREGLYVAGFLQGFLMDVWAFPGPDRPMPWVAVTAPAALRRSRRTV